MKVSTLAIVLGCIQLWATACVAKKDGLRNVRHNIEDPIVFQQQGQGQHEYGANNRVVTAEEEQRQLDTSLTESPTVSVWPTKMPSVNPSQAPTDTQQPSAAPTTSAAPSMSHAPTNSPSMAPTRSPPIQMTLNTSITGLTFAKGQSMRFNVTASNPWNSIRCTTRQTNASDGGQLYDVDLSMGFWPGQYGFETERSCSSLGFVANEICELDILPVVPVNIYVEVWEAYKGEENPYSQAEQIEVRCDEVPFQAMGYGQKSASFHLNKGEDKTFLFDISSAAIPWHNDPETQTYVNCTLEGDTGNPDLAVYEVNATNVLIASTQTETCVSNSISKTEVCYTKLSNVSSHLMAVASGSHATNHNITVTCTAEVIRAPTPRDTIVLDHGVPSSNFYLFGAEEQKLKIDVPVGSTVICEQSSDMTNLYGRFDDEPIFTGPIEEQKKHCHSQAADDKCTVFYLTEDGQAITEDVTFYMTVTMLDRKTRSLDNQVTCTVFPTTPLERDQFSTEVTSFAGPLSYKMPVVQDESVACTVVGANTGFWMRFGSYPDVPQDTFDCAISEAGDCVADNTVNATDLYVIMAPDDFGPMNNTMVKCGHNTFFPEPPPPLPDVYLPLDTAATPFTLKAYQSQGFIVNVPKQVENIACKTKATDGSDLDLYVYLDTLPEELMGLEWRCYSENEGDVEEICGNLELGDKAKVNGLNISAIVVAAATDTAVNASEFVCFDNTTAEVEL